MTINMTRKFLLLLTLCFGFGFLGISQATLTAFDTELSNQFKSLAGSDRDTIFTKHLYKLIRPVNSGNGDTTSSTLMGSKISTKDDVRMLLGTPTQAIPNNIDLYLILPGGTPKIVQLVYDRNKYVISWSIKN